MFGQGEPGHLPLQQGVSPDPGRLHQMLGSRMPAGLPGPCSRGEVRMYDGTNHNRFRKVKPRPRTRNHVTTFLARWYSRCNYGNRFQVFLVQPAASSKLGCRSVSRVVALQPLERTGSSMMRIMRPTQAHVSRDCTIKPPLLRHGSTSSCKRSCRSSGHINLHSVALEPV